MGYPVDAQGARIVSPTFANSEGLSPEWHGRLYAATAGALNIYDEVVTVERRIRAGWYKLLVGSQAELGDYLEFSVVDKDDVLGYFSVYGLTVGVDVLELKKYVIKEYVCPTAVGTRYSFESDEVFTVTAGLYLRTYYNSTGATDVDFSILTKTYA